MRMTEISKGWVCLVGRTTLLLVAGLLLLPGAARAQVPPVNVDCFGATPGAFTSINEAVGAGLQEIRVTGTCTENVFIANLDNVLIEAAEGETATIEAANSNENVFNIFGSHAIQLSGLVIRGGINGVFVTESDVTIGNTTIENNSVNGIHARVNGSVLLAGAVLIRNNSVHGIHTEASVLEILGFTTIENNQSAGMNLVAGRTLVDGAGGENIIRDNGAGVRISQGENARFAGQNTIQNNGNVGVSVFEGATVRFLGQGPNVTTIEGHARRGVQAVLDGEILFVGPHKIRNNGSAGGAFAGGIVVANSSSFLASQGTEITNNFGRGIHADIDSSISFGGVTISNNTGEGVLVRHLSVAEFFGPPTIFGNGVANIACDDTSLAFGVLTGITNIQCKLIEIEKEKKEKMPKIK